MLRPRLIVDVWTISAMISNASTSDDLESLGCPTRTCRNSVRVMMVKYLQKKTATINRTRASFREGSRVVVIIVHGRLRELLLSRLSLYYVVR